MRCYWTDCEWWNDWLRCRPTVHEQGLLLRQYYTPLKPLAWPWVLREREELTMLEWEGCLEHAGYLSREERDDLAEWLFTGQPRPLTQTALKWLAIWAPKWRLGSWWRWRHGRPDLDELSRLLWAFSSARIEEPDGDRVAKSAWRRLLRAPVSPERSAALLQVAGSFSPYWSEAWEALSQDDPRWDEQSASGLYALGANLCRAERLVEAEEILQVLVEHPMAMSFNFRPQYTSADRELPRPEFLDRYEHAIEARERRWRRVKVIFARKNMRGEGLAWVQRY